MAFDIDLPPSLASMLETLPLRTRCQVCIRLARIAEAAEHWPLGDLRWEQLARREDSELRLYVEGCVVRVLLQPAFERISVREIGRVLVHLPSGLPLPEPETSLEAAISC
jgi:hypothetical protein